MCLRKARKDIEVKARGRWRNFEEAKGFNILKFSILNMERGERKCPCLIRSFKIIKLSGVEFILKEVNLC